jgi:integrase
MPGKIASPWFRESKRAWYVCIAGKQHALGKDREEAFRRFHLLLAGAEPSPRKAEPKPEATLTVGQLATAYWKDCERRLAANPLRVAKMFLDAFAGACGTLPAGSVRKHHVEAWLGKHPTWGDSTQHMAKTRLIALFRWSVEQELLSVNPIAGIRKPPARSRGQDVVISPEPHARLMASAFPALRNVLFALHQSGARPGEVVSVTAADFHAEQSVWVLRKHKTAAKGKSRIVYLTPELVALCRELAQRYPKGPLFRNARGQPWHKIGVAKRLRELRERLGLRGIVPYGYRHSFATDALASGVPDAQVAELLGHQGTAMLHKHYAHLTARAQVLRAALDHVR